MGEAPAGSRPAEAGVALALDGFSAEVAPAYRPATPAELERLLDPGSAEVTVHWGRNYLYRATYETVSGPVPVVVKQFRTLGAWARLRRRLGGSKAAKSWRMARAFVRAGIPTAEPVALVESTSLAGPAFFLTRFVPGTVEARYLLRARNAGRLAEEFPELDLERFLGELGRLVRRLHEAGFFHRDLSIGNVLWRREGATEGEERLLLVDLNRARARRPGVLGRHRDLCRLALHRNEDRRLFLAAYWGEPPGALRRGLYLAFHLGFRGRLAAKAGFRRFFRGLRAWLLPRTVHAHIPAAPADAGRRDKVVWDALSDQPHQHAGRLEKLLLRAADLPEHLRGLAVVARAAPRVRRRYRELRAALYREPVRFDGLGIAVRPAPEEAEALLDALDALGVRRVLLRLQPWDGRYDDEEALASELRRRGYELAFAVPQNRALVVDAGRWRAQLEEIAARFLPWGDAFQIGQAINRSKWGIWTPREYLRLASVAAEVLRAASPRALILGPAVIDFELQATAAVVNRPEAPRFDVLASLLYVDRRGAPENPQLGFDSVGKVLLTKAIADTARRCGPRSWITEVNWPLWEGPHSPAGRSVSVDERRQADYLARFYLMTLATGAVERVYWWQLLARGYGLVAPRESAAGAWRRRPSFAALATLQRLLGGSLSRGPLPAPPGVHLYRFETASGEWIAGWTTASTPVEATLPGAAVEAVAQDGEALSPPDGVTVELKSAVRYWRLGDGAA